MLAGVNGGYFDGHCASLTYNKRIPSLRGSVLFSDEWQPSSLAVEADALIQKGLSDTIIGTRLAATAALVQEASKRSFTVIGDYLEVDLLDTPLPLPTLPAGYGFKGGAARTALSVTLGRAPLPPRDLDLVRFGHSRTKQDAAVAQEFMPHDYQHGGTVELITNINRHLNSRDITINEVFLFSTKLTVGPYGILDSLSRILRASRYQPGSLSRSPQVSGRVLLKMLRLRAELFLQGERWKIVGLPEEATVQDIDLALHLEKALQRGVQTAELFLQYCRHAGLISHINEPLLSNILRELAHFTVGETALLRSVPEQLRECCLLE